MSSFGLTERIFNITDQHSDFLVMDVFRFQAIHNSVYAHYLEALKLKVDQVQSVDQIPYLPISFFKSHQIKTGNWQAEKVFQSSGTTQQLLRSQHFIKSLAHYQQVSRTFFEQQYGSLDQWHLLALLPSYLEREGSSLVYMIDHFIQQSKSEHAGFYLNDVTSLLKKIKQLKSQADGRKIMLFGVSFALLDLAESGPHDLSGITIMETGGMKGRRKEMTRFEVHDSLSQAFNNSTIHAEYGMTELLSQAYSGADGLYQPAPWMRIRTREINDPFQEVHGKTGIIKVMDLANIDSCAFIETQDLGIVHSNGKFEIQGRSDNAEMRGCSLMVSGLG